MSDYQIPMIAVRVVIENSDGAVLILKRARTGSANGRWCLPGGKVDFGRTLEQTAAREVLEETGLVCRRLSWLYYLETLPSPELPTHYITFYFHCRSDGRPTINDESSDFQWITSSTFHNFNLAFANDEALQRFWSGNR